MQYLQDQIKAQVSSNYNLTLCLDDKNQASQLLSWRRVVRDQIGTQVTQNLVYQVSSELG